MFSASRDARQEEVMRSMLVRSTMAGAVLLLAAGSAKASPLELLDVKVPFPFTVDGKSFPAGQYRIDQDDSLGTQVLLIRGMHSPQAAIVVTRPAGRTGPVEPAVTFTRHEGQYRLSAVWESQDEGQAVR